jgi:hypothetical protein
MGHDEDSRNLLGDLQFLGLLEMFPQCYTETLALDEFEHKKITVIPFDVIIDLADVGVLELGEHTRFSEESGFCLRIQARFCADRFDCDLPFESFVYALIDISHASASEDIHYADVSDSFSQQTHSIKSVDSLSTGDLLLGNLIDYLFDNETANKRSNTSCCIIEI